MNGPAGESGTESAPILQIEGITAGYGAVTVLRGVSLSVEVGSVVALLGPNGAGKTTTLRVASGFLSLKEGRVSIGGVDATRLSAHQRARLGLCLIPEGHGVFRTLTVRENLRLAIPPWVKGSDYSIALDTFPILKQRIESRAGVLSGGEQQMLALARCYLAKPQVILADELSMGLAPNIVEAIFSFLTDLASTGVSILLVEQYVNKALEIADTAYLLDRGSVIYAGPSSGLDEEAVVRGYLGT